MYWNKWSSWKVDRQVHGPYWCWGWSKDVKKATESKKEYRMRLREIEKERIKRGGGGGIKRNENLFAMHAPDGGLMQSFTGISRLHASYFIHLWQHFLFLHVQSCPKVARKEIKIMALWLFLPLSSTMSSRITYSNHCIVTAASTENHI